MVEFPLRSPRLRYLTLSLYLNHHSGQIWPRFSLADSLRPPVSGVSSSHNRSIHPKLCCPAEHLEHVPVNLCARLPGAAVCPGHGQALQRRCLQSLI